MQTTSGSLDLLLKLVADAVYTKLGPYHRESVYQKALCLELSDRGLFVEQEVNIAIEYPLKQKMLTLAIERADIVLNQSCVIEIKVGEPKAQAVQAAIGQTRRYQRFYRNGQAKLGFVVFFGPTESRCIKVTQVEAGREEDREDHSE